MIATFAAFDTANFVVPLRKILPPALVVVLAAVVTPWPVTSVVAGAVVMTLLAPHHFADDERSDLDVLYSTLPVDRRTVVIGRYLSLLLVYLAVAALATLATVVVSGLEGSPVPVDVLVPAHLGSLIFFCVAVAVQLPFFFALGHARARPMIYVPVVVLSAGTWLLGQTSLFDGLDPRSVASLDPVPAWSAGAAGALALFVASAAVSVVLYRRRPL